MLVEREDCNRIAYGSNVTATQLLSGRIDPPGFAQPLLDALTTRAGGTQDFDPTVLGGGGWQDDSPAESPSAYEFGSENPFASAGVGGKKVRSKRGMSTGSWKGSSKDSDGAKTPDGTRRSRNNTITAWHDDYAPIPGETSPGGRLRSSTIGRRFDPHQSSPLAGGSPTTESPIGSRSASANPFQGGKVVEQTTPIIEKDRFDFSAARDALSSDSDSNASRPSIDSFDGSRNYRVETIPLTSSKRTPPSSKSPTNKSPSSKTPPRKRFDDDLITFNEKPSSTSYRKYDVNDFNYPKRQSPSSSSPSSRVRDDPFSNKYSPGRSRKASGSSRAVPNDFAIPSSPAAGGDENLAVALWDFNGQEDGDLSFKKGDVIIITKRTDDQWCAEPPMCFP